MTMRRAGLASIAFLCGAVAAAPVAHQPSKNGVGYQEIKLEPKLYYLSINGRKKTSGPELERAWALRAVELCAAEGTSHFVRLEHLFERVLAADPIAALRAKPGPVKVKGGPIYIPIYTPSGPSFIDEPAFGAHLRCVDAASTILPPERLFPVKS